MVKYHGTPIGGSAAEAREFLTNRHGLVAEPHQDHMPIVAEYCASFILDNGAYTVWQQGGKLDYERIIAFYDTWHRHPGFDWAIIPDVIEGTERDNDRYLEMFPSHIKGVPVYHNYFPVSRLKKLADKYEVIALGSSGRYHQIGSKIWWDRMNEMMKAICDDKGRPCVKLHGLRLLDSAVFTKLPLSSADSSNAARNNTQLKRFGCYPSPKASIRAAAIASRHEVHNSAPVWHFQEEQTELIF